MGTLYIAISDIRKEVMLLSKSVVLYYAVASDSGTDPVGYTEYTGDSLRNLIDRCLETGLYNPDDPIDEFSHSLNYLSIDHLEKLRDFQPDRLISEHHPAYSEFDSPSDPDYIGDYIVTHSLYGEPEFIGKSWLYYWNN